MSDELFYTSGNAETFLALLDKIGAEREWEHQAACRDEDPSLFFAPTGIRPDAAKEVCGRCPVREECYEAGKEEVYGIWGATSPEERRQYRRRMRRRLGLHSRSPLP